MYSNNAGIFLVGSGHSVSEALIESTDWLGSLAFPPLKIGFNIHKPSAAGQMGLDMDLRSDAGVPTGTANCNINAISFHFFY